MAQLGGPLYAIGGLDDNMCFSEEERYDIATDSWSYAASMNMARGGVAVATLNDHIYAGQLRSRARTGQGSRHGGRV